jgi:hypothetical protein
MELTNLILSISGILITMLLAIIGFFLKRQVSVVECLTDSVNALNVSMEVVRNNEINYKVNCGTRHSGINKTLETHQNRLEDQKTAIAIINTTLTQIQSEINNIKQP